MYSPPAADAAALLPQLVAGPITVGRACAGCERRGCDPADCEDARRFERLVEELQGLEERGLVRLWLYDVYSPHPDAHAVVRVRLTEAGRVALAAAP